MLTLGHSLLGATDSVMKHPHSSVSTEAVNGHSIVPIFSHDIISGSMRTSYPVLELILTQLSEMTVEVPAAASALPGLETVTASHEEKDDDESDGESDREESQDSDDEDSLENGDYEGNEVELFN